LIILSLYHPQFTLSLFETCYENFKFNYGEKKNRFGEKKIREENKEKVAEREKKYREENKEKIAERVKKYRENNKEKVAEREKKYREENKEKIDKYRKEKIKCECGAIIRRDSYSKHLKTNKHLKNIEGQAEE